MNPTEDGRLITAISVGLLSKNYYENLIDNNFGNNPEPYNQKNINQNFSDDQIKYSLQKTEKL